MRLLQERFYNQEYSLATHKRTHTGYKPYECNIFKTRFSQSSSLRRHTRTHTVNNACEYDACNKECSGSSDLAVHKREQDEDEHVESGGQDKIFPVSSASMVCDITVNYEECDVSNEGYIDRQCLDENKCYHV
jgi:uncharacterized Zn-finger protein